MKYLMVIFLFFLLKAASCFSADDGKPEPRLVVEGRPIADVLYLENAYHQTAGLWQISEVCPNGSFAHAIEIKYEKQGHVDETAVNGIKLYCSDNSTGVSHTTGYVNSTYGPYGEWFGMRVCPTGYIRSIQVNVLEYQGTFTDDVAIENVRAQCENGDVVEGLPMDVPDSRNFQLGKWSLWETCDRPDSYVCGLQTRYEDASLGDETAVCDVRFFCCFAYD